MNKFITQIKAEIQGEVQLFAGPVIEADNWLAAENYLQENGLGYCTVVGYQETPEQELDRLKEENLKLKERESSLLSEINLLEAAKDTLTMSERSYKEMWSRVHSELYEYKRAFPDFKKQYDLNNNFTSK